MSAAPLPSPRLIALRAEVARREAERTARAKQLAEVVAQLRGKQEAHPKQRAALRSVAKQIAILATRRAGKTSGMNAELMARALEVPRYRATYCNATRVEAMGLAWESDTQDGWKDLLVRFGKVHPDQDGCYLIGGVTVKPNHTDLTLTFSNGSKLDIFAADDPKALDKFRGRAKHAVVVDEAQKFPDLVKFCGPVCSGVVKDFQGQIILQGTPGEDCAGQFYEVTKPLDHGDRVPGWEVHEFGVTDNPFFGADYEERYERAVRPEIEAKGLTIDDPTVQREWFGKWVREGTRYVYPVNLAPAATLTFAPVRMSSSWQRTAAHVRDLTPQVAALLAQGGWYDHDKAVDDLPRRKNGRPRDWLFGLGCDFGFDPDPVALVVVGFTLEMPDVWEMFSWKRTRLVPDDWRCLVELLWRQLDDELIAIVGDPGGLVGANMNAWRERLGIPIENADKAGKRSWQEMVGGDIRTGRIHYREGSELLTEHRHLVWMPSAPGRPAKEHADRKLPDGSVPGNHCADSFTYVYRHLTHHQFRSPPPAASALERDEAYAEQAAEQATAIALAERDESDGWEPVERDY
ncbi:MAG: hypothetical protein KBD62_32225 [Kofleriaceae bacterium]|nr:hypothetical protein [Kofleriaceae bacterium]